MDMALSEASRMSSGQFAGDSSERTVSGLYEGKSMPVPQSGDIFAPFEESALKMTAAEPVSTFSIDVDTASYSYVRQALEGGYLPPPDAVRIEEMVNYFPYAYPAPASARTPFATSVSVYPTPWNKRTRIVHIGIKGHVPPAEDTAPSNLVFLLDTSGSMDAPDKLPLLKKALGLLVDSLGPEDTVAIVAYAGSAGVVLEPTRASESGKILRAMDGLGAGGSTAGGQGIELAYALAEEARIEGGNNRVILATDGDFNVGISEPDALVDFIKTKRDNGIFLSVLGFGQGNLGDDTMQALAQNGNGNAAYIDGIHEARKVLVEQGVGTLHTIAKDVKIQVEFNPATVAEYRLIGYETRALAREDFNDDKVDAGDIGAGHTVTALYEITPVGSGAESVDPLRYGAKPEADATPVIAPEEYGFLKLRYKLPESSESVLLETPISTDLEKPFTAQSDDIRFAAAVAAFGQKLRGSTRGAMDWKDIEEIARGARGEDEHGYRSEFMQLVVTASTLGR